MSWIVTARRLLAANNSIDISDSWSSFGSTGVICTVGVSLFSLYDPFRTLLLWYLVMTAVGRSTERLFIERRRLECVELEFLLCRKMETGEGGGKRDIDVEAIGIRVIEADLDRFSDNWSLSTLWLADFQSFSLPLAIFLTSELKWGRFDWETLELK